MAAAGKGERKKPFIIGIAGGTGAGKTTFAQSIYAGFGGIGWGGKSDATTTQDGVVVGGAVEGDGFGSIAYLSHDHYYRDLAHLPMEDRGRNNFDHPDSLDTDLLIHHLAELIQGRTVVVPRYDFKRHCRYQEGEIDNEGLSTGRVVECKRIILVEGILIFSVKALVQLMDLKIFVDAPSDIRLTRRIQRDAVERGRTLADILRQYLATVRPMHDEFVEPSKYNADLILHSYDENRDVSIKRMETAMRVICNHLKMETLSSRLTVDGE